MEYSYRDVPTIKRFSTSRKFIRGLMGPFGSGISKQEEKSKFLISMAARFLALHSLQMGNAFFPEASMAVSVCGMPAVAGSSTDSTGTQAV